MELSHIIGNSTEMATIILYGFLQQHILFSAFSGNLPGTEGTALAFLADMTTMFTMIGLLVLVFSPNLWKPKYIISWVFLFVSITLGGALGNTIGYNLSSATGQEYLNKPVAGSNLNCSKKSSTTNGYCPTEVGTDSIAFEYLKSDTIKEVLKNQKSVVAPIDNNVQSNGSVGLSNEIIGFYPHVLILYLTNKFRFDLEYALYDLNSRNFSHKQQALSQMLSAKLPNPQLGMWLYLFDNLCSAKSNIPVTDLLSSNMARNKDIMHPLESSDFTVKDLIPAVRFSSVVEKSDTRAIAPLIDFVTPNLGQSVTLSASLLDSASTFYKKQSKTINANEIIRYFTINYPTNVANDVKIFFGIVEGTTNAPSLFTSSTLANQYPNSNLLRYYSDLNHKIAFKNLKKTFHDAAAFRNTKNEKYAAGAELAFKSDFAQTPARLIIPIYDATRKDMNNEVRGAAAMASPSNTDKTAHCYRSMNSTNCGLNYMKEDESKFVAVSNCAQLYRGIVSQYTSLMKKDNDDFVEKVQIKQVYNNTYAATNNMRSGTKDGLRAHKAFLQQMTVMAKYCEEKSGATYSVTSSSDATKLNKCTQEYIDPIMKHYKQAAVSNYLANAKSNVSRFMGEQASIHNGISGLSFAAGEKFTEFFTAPLTGIFAIAQSFKAGAYSAILPIIKNIVLAFIIICTPILFLLGLLVPSWAPGVIITSLVALIFLQMTDVIMVVVQTILTAIEAPIKALVMNESSRGTVASYQAFMEVIWGIAYMSTFAITAFFLFAAGNSKAIIGKMAGLDSKIESVSKDIYSNGWKVTKALATKTAPVMGEIDGATRAAMDAYKAPNGGVWSALGVISSAVGGSASGDFDTHSRDSYNKVQRKTRDEADAFEDLSKVESDPKGRNRQQIMLADENSAHGKKRRQEIERQGLDMSDEELHSRSVNSAVKEFSETITEKHLDNANVKIDRRLLDSQKIKMDDSSTQKTKGLKQHPARLIDNFKNEGGKSLLGNGPGKLNKDDQAKFIRSMSKFGDDGINGVLGDGKKTFTDEEGNTHIYQKNARYSQIDDELLNKSLNEVDISDEDKTAFLEHFKEGRIKTADGKWIKDDLFSAEDAKKSLYYNDGNAPKNSRIADKLKDVKNKNNR